MIRTMLVLAIFILAGSAGELAMTHGMKKVGEPERLRPWQVLKFVWKAVHTGWFWVGVPLMAVNFYLLMVLLSWEPISLIIPASALSYVVGTLGAKYVLHEDVNALRWAGVFLVCTGVAIATVG